MNWVPKLAAVALTVLLTVTGCGSAPAPTPSSVPSTPNPTPTVPLGPALTAAQYDKLVASGTLGDRKVKLVAVKPSSNEDPDGEGSENQQANQAVSCVAMNKLADSRVKSQAADEAGGVIVQLYNDAPTVVELVSLNQKCAAEEAKLDAGTAVTMLGAGQEGSAMWWLTKDPGGLYQVTIGYGNVLAYTLLDGPDVPTSLVVAVRGQVDELAKK